MINGIIENVNIREDVIDMNIQEDCLGYIYLVRSEEYKSSDLNVYKVGRTENYPFERLKCYGTNIDVYIIISSDNHKELERNLINKFNETFELVQGYEWFQGDVELMMKMVYNERVKICKKYKSILNDIDSIIDDISNDFVDNPNYQEYKELVDKYPDYIDYNTYSCLITNREEYLDVLSKVYNNYPDMYFMILSLISDVNVSKHLYDDFICVCNMDTTIINRFINFIHTNIKHYKFTRNSIRLYVTMLDNTHDINDFCIQHGIKRVNFYIKDINLCQDIYKILIYNECFENLLNLDPILNYNKYLRYKKVSIQAPFNLFKERFQHITNNEVYLKCAELILFKYPHYFKCIVYDANNSMFGMKINHLMSCIYSYCYNNTSYIDLKTINIPFLHTYDVEKQNHYINIINSLYYELCGLNYFDRGNYELWCNISGETSSLLFKISTINTFLSSSSRDVGGNMDIIIETFNKVFIFDRININSSKYNKK